MVAMIHIGQPAPDFTLPDLDGKTHPLSAFRGRIAVLNFWSADCPHATRADALLAAYLAEWQAGVAWLSIASNAGEPLHYQAQAAARRHLPLLLLDPEHQVADLYSAQTTPHLFVVDAQGLLRYQGAFDNVTFRQRISTQPYLRQAVEALLAGRSPDPAEKPPYGCSILRHWPA